MGRLKREYGILEGTANDRTAHLRQPCGDMHPVVVLGITGRCVAVLGIAVCATLTGIMMIYIYRRVGKDKTSRSQYGVPALLGRDCLYCGGLNKQAASRHSLTSYRASFLQDSPCVAPMI